MRLTLQQIEAIKESFSKYFSTNDHIWLFGSRADPTKKGGDIDLYIETTLDDISDIAARKIDFLVFIKRKIGEQKIDVVINILNDNKKLFIYDEAKSTGVQLI